MHYIKYILGILILLVASCNNKKESTETAEEVLEIIHRVNQQYQSTHKAQVRSFWDDAVYHTGNMEVYALTGNKSYMQYSIDWAEYNQWKGATGNNKSEWLSTYGETPEYVLFGDWQICFQTYADLYKLNPDTMKIARAREVMEYQMSTLKLDYWHWVDALYMVMPVMVKMYDITQNPLYLEKLYQYLATTDSIMYDTEAGLYYRDAKYLYPVHQTINGKKDFWARGNGWAFAALAKVLKQLPTNDKYRPEYIARYQAMAKALATCQQPEGYWTRSLIDPDQAPGAETSGTALFTYSYLWGINNGLLDANTYLPIAEKSWKYLKTVALQADGKIGYIQPIGEKAIPGQIVDADSYYNFGVGVFLLAACERVRFLK
jgi:hypothetical protein